MKFFKRKLDLKAMSQITPTSKFDLKMQCLAIARGDIAEADRIYTFFAADLNIPDVSPPVPSLMEQVKSTAANIFNFVKENRDDFAQAYNYVQMIRQGAPLPVGESATEAAATAAAAAAPGIIPPLPPI